MKNLTFNHIYDCYPLYKVTHQRPAGYRTTEMQHVNVLLSASQQQLKTKSALKGTHVYELLAGEGEYQRAWDHMSSLTGYPKYDTWASIEGVAPRVKVPNQFIGDVCSFQPPGEYNLLMSPYFGLDSVLDMTTPEYTSTSEAIGAAIANNGKILAKHGGWYYAHFVSQHDQTLAGLGKTHTESQIPPKADLRKLVGIGDDVYATMEMELHTVYDRHFGGFKEIAKPYVIRSGNRAVAKITIKNPMVWRHYSEQEIANMLRRGGFDLSKTLWASFNPASGYTTDILPAVVEQAVDPNTEVCYANCFMAYHPKLKS